MTDDAQEAASVAWPAVLVAAFVLAIALFEFYFVVYRVRHIPLPVGFDTSWYIWRAAFVAKEGIGRLGTDVRPGHAVLAAIIGSVTGRSQLELGVILPPLVVSVFALALGAFWSAAVDGRSWTWLIVVAVGGTLLGATRLVGENVANLLHVALVAAALAAVARRLDGGRGAAAAVVLLVGSGLVHWVFLGVFGGVLAVSVVLALPASMGEWRSGVQASRTEAGLLTVVGVATGGAMAVLVAGVLHAPFQTFEIREDPKRFLPKFKTDLKRLRPALVGPVAAVGVAALARDPLAVQGRSKRSRGFARRILMAWTTVMVLGMGYGVVSNKLPPHRFLGELVAVPGAVALAAGLAFLAHWVGSRLSRPVGVALALAGVAALSIPGATRWYRGGPGLWIDPVALKEDLTAARYIDSLPPDQPFVFLVDPFGKAGIISVPLKERDIRVGLPPERQASFLLFAGQPADLLAGRRTVIGQPGTDRAIAPYWEDVRPVLAEHPPVLILEALAEVEYQAAVTRMGARVIGPGVALLQGPAPGGGRLAAAPLPAAVPRVPTSVLIAAAILVMLGAAGTGWTRALLGPGVAPEVFWGVVPAMGAAALIVGGVVADRLGLRLGGTGGIVTFVLVAGLGWAVAARDVGVLGWRSDRSAG